MTTVTDDFNRANETPLAAPWVEVGVVGREMNLSSNHVVPADLSIDCQYGYGASFAADQAAYAILTCTGTGGGTGPGLAVRCGTVHSQNSYIMFVDHAASLNVHVQRVVADVHTDLDSFTQAWTDGDTWGFKATGVATATVLTIYLNGTLVRTVAPDNSTLGTGTPGICYSSTATASTIDTFTGTDVFGPTPGPGDDPPIGILGRGAGW